jgi:hypothetical protein
MADDFDIPFTPSGNQAHDLRRARAIKVMKFLDDMGVDPDEGAQVCLYVASMVIVDSVLEGDS